MTRRPHEVQSARRGWLRISEDSLEDPRIEELSDAEFRALVGAWCYIARVGDGEISRRVLASYLRERFGRRAPRILAKLVGVGLFEEFVYDDNGQEVLVVDNWKSFRPSDPTGAERARRYRKRKFAGRYHGYTDDVQQIGGTTPAEREGVEA
jgi:hypothetical protein